MPALPFGGCRGGMDSETTSSGRKTTVAPDIVIPDKTDSAAESGEAAITPESTWLQSMPFTQPIPPALIQAVIKELASANSAYAHTCRTFHQHGRKLLIKRYTVVQFQRCKEIQPPLRQFDEAFNQTQHGFRVI